MHHPVELPTHADRHQGLPGTHRGLYRRRQTLRGRTARREHPGRDLRRDRAAGGGKAPLFIVLDNFSRISRACTIQHAPCAVLYPESMLITCCLVKCNAVSVSGLFRSLTWCTATGRTSASPCVHRLRSQFSPPFFARFHQRRHHSAAPRVVNITVLDGVC